MDLIPIYIKIDILIELDYDSFLQMFFINKEFYSIFNGLIDPDFGNVTEYLYKKRTEKYINPDIIKFKSENLVLDKNHFKKSFEYINPLSRALSKSFSL